MSGQKFDRAKLECGGKQESMINDKRKVSLYATGGGELGGGLAHASRWQSRRTTGWLAYPAHSVIVHRCLTTGGWVNAARSDKPSCLSSGTGRLAHGGPSNLTGMESKGPKVSPLGTIRPAYIGQDVTTCGSSKLTLMAT